MRKVTKSDCSGCKNNFYNGNNPYGVKECWSFPNAKLVKKLDIPIDLRPPYNRKALVARPNCYKAKGYVRVDLANLREDGYWKS